MSQRSAVFLEFVRAGVLLGAFFGVVFYGADYLAAARSDRLALFFEWEREIPFIGPVYAVYYSVVALPFLVPFLLDDVRHVRAWRNRMAIAIAIAGVIFVLFPVESGYPPKTGADWQLIRDLTAIVTGKYNLMPSLHVALMLVCMASFWPRLSATGKAWMSGWGIALVASTLFTHQHHILDLMAGMLLAVLVSVKLPAR